MKVRAINSFNVLTEIEVPDSLSVILPVLGFVTQAFGIRSVTGITHRGIDLSCSVGNNILALADGRVSFTYTNGRDMPGLESDGSPGGYGNQVYIDHGDGVESRYAHLSRVDVAIGQTVKQGAVVGLSGTTGISSGPHLHAEVRLFGWPLDWWPLIGRETDDLAGFDDEDRAVLRKLIDNIDQVTFLSPADKAALAQELTEPDQPAPEIPTLAAAVKDLAVKNKRRIEDIEKVKQRVRALEVK